MVAPTKYFMAIDIQDQWPPELQSQTTLPWSSSAQKPGVLQPEPAVGDEPLSGYRLFDIRPLVMFVEQFPHVSTVGMV